MKTKLNLLNLTIDQLRDGYYFDENTRAYHCLFCEECFNQGQVYRRNDKYFEAHLAIEHHIACTHGSSAATLLKLDKKVLGLTDRQRELFVDLIEKLNDKDIANKRSLSMSTIRHQRFMMREKYKHAKLYIALYDAINACNDHAEPLVEPHVGATMVDERYILTESEKQKIIARYFSDAEHLTLTSMPAKEKRKIVILERISREFSKSTIYSEPELNERLKLIYPDLATLRRYLIEYGFLNRKKDGSSYWFN